MSTTEAPFIIAVIREKEKSLLGDNEITRIMHASSASEAREVLMSTPYAVFLSDGTSVPDALVRALEAEFAWLQDSLDDNDILAYIAARYDVLHLAQAIIAYASNVPHIQYATHIGTLTHEMLYAMVFTQEYVASKESRFWLACVQTQKKAIAEQVWNMPFLFESMRRVLEDRLTALAKTPLTRALAQHVQSRHAADKAWQKGGVHADVAHYESEWDSRAIALVRELRFEPVGYDPIVAYWITREMEVKKTARMFAALTHARV
ncbi:MAG: hypothetical protein A3C02_04755 [Candidatus Andersenbacteria bacterium RIFCSPHIGHO2_02_FULL_45_11]|uniref:Uncharacterized protein n=1 Tax=Candidatus Andersenbacteria bacterium RIFCSPHIGHO2_12_FULL_45_11 TaxID=1797281 RepID=A0A1G1WZ78_9BACT|nr:MAG: hypothetical protein A2805_00850 [Candidatus Andersenbacteria bacterium RIFCSPHIGHO2_01_FULL_46_36]OGY31920.1 MAG: hypothetical protein A3C02_04755 [Candidatus Andersenbacteria bacterium RIFCSPHIGHO2_02_FULL_45_11]OGY33062.1 MAG: hypothetical protein A3D99_01230 [Candidatus Andersenbacteria bacterium RIFCSPHIGHO2_12_FULL_45_11]